MIIVAPEMENLMMIVIVLMIAIVAISIHSNNSSNSKLSVALETESTISETVCWLKTAKTESGKRD